MTRAPDLVRLLASLLAAPRGGRGRDALGTTPPRRVVHLLPSAGWGGAERVACTIHRLSLDRGLASRLDAPSLPALDDAIAAETGVRPAAPRPGEDTLVGWARAARARVAAAPPDLVHAHLPYPDRLGLALLAARGLPLVATFQLLPDPARSFSPDELLGWRSDRVLARLGRLAPRARYVAVSEADRARLARLLGAGRVALVRNVPPLPRAAPPRGARAAAAPPWPAGAVRLLSVGRLHAQKGFDRLVPALAAPALRALPWHWCLVGDGPERAALAAALAAAGLAARATFLEDVPATAVYPTAELVLSPSRYEGMPLVPMEAVEAGLPVLASGIAAHRELFGRVRGALVERADEPSVWSARLAELVRDAGARAALATAERAALPPDPRGELWESYAELYRTLSTARR